MKATDATTPDTGAIDTAAADTDAAVEHDIAAWLIARSAPEERGLFPLISAAYDRDPARVATGTEGRDEMFGFGVLETATVLLTPVVLAAVTEVVGYLAGEVGAAMDVRSWLRRRLRQKSDTTVDGLALDARQRERIRDIVLTRCRQAGVRPERSELVADGVISALDHGI